MSDLYTFKLRGSEATPTEPSQTWTFKAGVAPARIFVGSQADLIATELKWGADAHEHGGETTMHATLANHDGSEVRFVVEHEQDGKWLRYAVVPAVLKGLEAIAPLRVHHPALPPVGEPPHPAKLAEVATAQLRFRVEYGAARPQPTAKTASVKATSTPPAAPEPEHGEIRVGSAIAPPKLLGFIADGAAEQKWFNKLQRITAADLQPGDILLRKKWDGGPVVLAQKLFKAEKASKFTSHAMLYLGDGKIAHAYEVPMALAVSDVPDFNLIIWRAVDSKAAAAAAATARRLVATNQMKYSVEDCMGTAFSSHEWGPEAEGRARLVAEGKLPTERTMCSEFVAYCYQSEAGKPAIRIDAKRTCPMRLENYLNQHPETFRFAGAIHQVGDGSGGSKIVMSKVLDTVGGELRENFTHAGKSAEGAAKKISGGAKKISGGAKKAASALKKLF